MYLPQAAHLAHVLLAAERVNHRARAEEEQRLEERVRHQVEHAGAVRADAAGQQHVAELRDGRVGEHALDVVLHHADGRGEERRQRADDRDHSQARSARDRRSRSSREIMYTPAVTIVAAWISAETGVGPSIASGSQT